MKLNSLSSPRIIHINPEEDWEIAGQVERVFRVSEISPDRTKDVSVAALLGDEVVGGIYSGWVEDTDRDAWVYSFDVAVLPDRRNTAIGRQLIQAALADYAAEKGDYGDRTVISLYVVNPRLAQFLETQLGFEVVADYGHGSSQLEKY